MVTTLIVAFIVLTFVAILLWGAGDLLLAKFRPRHSNWGEDMEDGPLPFLIFPVDSQESSVTPLPVGATKSALPVQNIPAPAWHGAAIGARSDDVAHEEWLPPRPGRATVRETFRNIPVTPLADAPVGATMVFQRPVDQPVQILPGRFEVVAGDHRREDIRFIGQIGAEALLTIGRTVGAPHDVVTLQSPTVSRRHAQMQFADGCWTISNLSETNPVIVNDEALDRVGRAHRLVDGDRVELGEVVLRFHAH